MRAGPRLRAVQLLLGNTKIESSVPFGAPRFRDIIKPAGESGGGA